MTPEAVAEYVDADAVVDLLQEAIGIPSVTPHEEDFARWVHDQLDDNAWDHRLLAPFEGTRANVYASVGHGRPSLVLAGHLDTVHADDWAKHWAGTERANPFAASIIGQEIWGRGSADQKAGICAILEALRAIHRSGCRPTGSVTALFVCDEESGQPGSGISAGMKAAMADGEVQQDHPADFLVYTEPTTSAIYTAQMGFFIADIALTGQSAYFGRPELGVDALKAGHHLLTALWEHSDNLRAQPAHPLIGEAFLLVTEVRSGESIAVPGRFDLSLIRKVLPRESLDAAAQSIRDITAQVAADHGVEASVEFTAPRDHSVGGTPDETSTDHPAVQALGASIAATTGDEPRIEAAPYWSEKSFLSAIGVPGVYFAPGDISNAHTPFERVEIDELVAATRTLAHFVASWCGLEPAPTTQMPNHQLKEEKPMQPRKKSRWLVLGTLLAVFVLLAAACGNDDDSGSDPTAAPATAAPTAAPEPPDEPDPEPEPEPTEDEAPAMEAPVTQGPNGETASPSGDIVLTADELAQVQEGGYTAALLWHISGAFTDAVSQGARDAFAEMGIEVVVETEAGFDAAQQANDVETAMALSPDIILSLTIDPVSAAEGFRPAVDAGVQLVFLSTTPEGYTQGQEFVGVVTDDLAAMGIAAANLLGNALGGEGEIGYIFHDAPFYVTNQRDQAFKAWIEINFPGIEIVAEQGLADPAAAEDIASAMLTRNPGLDGIYAPWSAGPADGVLAALRAAGASDVAVVTMDLDTNVSLDLVEGGNIVGIAADEAYEIGRTMATEGAYGLLGKQAPPFVVVPAIEVTADNIVEAYRVSLAADPPQEVLDALGG